MMVMVVMMMVMKVSGESVHSPVLGVGTQVRRDYTVFSHNKKVSIGLFLVLSIIFINTKLIISNPYPQPIWLVHNDTKQ